MLMLAVRLRGSDFVGCQGGRNVARAASIRETRGAPPLARLPLKKVALIASETRMRFQPVALRSVCGVDV